MRRGRSVKNELMDWIKEIKNSGRGEIPLKEVEDRLDRIIWNELKIHDTPTGNALNNYERKGLYWQALKKYALKSNENRLLELLIEIEEIVEKEQVNYDIQGLYPTKYVDTDMLEEEETYIHKKELNRKYGKMQKEQLNLYKEVMKD